MPTTLQVDVRPLDLTDDRALRRWYDVAAASELHDRPWAPHWSYDEMAVAVRADDGVVRWTLTGAYDGDEMVGAALLQEPLLDNLDKAYVEVHVAPPHRRRGVGSRLLADTVDRVRGLGRSVVLTETAVPAEQRDDHPYVRFGRSHGFTVANVEVRRVLRLPLADEVLDGMAHEAARHHQGYRILTFHDELPEALLPSFVQLQNLLAVDAPTGDIDFEEEGLTPDAYRQHMVRLAQQGRHKLVSVAVDAAGEVVAHSDLVVPPGDRPKVYQWGTLVRRDHRGHRLGAAVKVANLMALQRRYPERTEVYTTNSEDNAAMVGINERLGFRVVELCPELMLRL